MGVCLVGEYVEDREKWDVLRLSAAEISIVSFPLTLKIVLTTFWYTPSHRLSLCQRTRSTLSNVLFMFLTI